MAETHIHRDLRSLRKAKRLTLRALAKACGRTPGYLSQIENGNATPSLETVGRIADALGVEVSWFFPVEAGRDDRERGVIVRSQARRRLSRMYSFDTSELGYQDFLLSDDLDLGLTMGLSRYEPGGRTHGAPASSSGHICGFVLRGRVRLILDNDNFVLSVEDSFSFDLARRHDIQNDQGEVSEVLWAISPVRLDF